MSKLPLKTRKDLRDTEAKAKEHLATIQKALDLPVEPTLEADWDMLSEEATKAGREHGAGTLVNDQLLKAIADNIVKLASDKLAKEALVAAWTTGVLKVGTHPCEDFSDCHRIDIEDGALVHVFKSGNLGSWQSYAGRNLGSKLAADDGLPLAAAQNIAEYKPQIEAELKLIQKALDLPVEVTSDVNYETLNAEAKSSSRENQPGYCWHAIVKSIRENLQNKAKDDLFKASMQEFWSTGVLQHREDAAVGSDAHDVIFEDGNLVHRSTSGNLNSWTSYAARSIEKHLTSDGLPLAANQNIAEYKPQIEAELKLIQKAFNLPVDVTYEIDWPSFNAEAKASSRENQPGYCWHAIVKSFRENAQNLGKDEMVQEGVQEIWTTGVIKHREDAAVGSDAHDCRFEDGDLVLRNTSGNLNSWTSYCGKKLEDLL